MSTRDERFWARVNQTSGCWLWTGYVMPIGYGQVRRRGAVLLAHRYAYEQTVGPIDDAMEIAHLCDNRACVRPSHLMAAPISRGPQRDIRSIEDRFWPKVAKSPSCWLWTGARTGIGYGALRGHDETLHAHRFSYELHVGPIPAELELDHLCRVRHCVNPGHLEAVTHRENMRRGMRWPQKAAA